MIAAEGEQKASRALKEASEVIAESSSALQLRYLQARVGDSAGGRAPHLWGDGAGERNVADLFSTERQEAKKVLQK